MRHFISGTATTSPIGFVDVARWDQYSLGDTLPFEAMWYTVPPNSSPPEDRHPEVELSIVVSGTASVEASGQITDVQQGQAFLLGSEEGHIIHNRSLDTPLVVFSAYWMPDSVPDLATVSEEASQ
ncbi:MAG TPA: cupin domain-containing protein [Micromonosporaceae bacterium]